MDFVSLEAHEVDSFVVKQLGLLKVRDEVLVLLQCLPDRQWELRLSNLCLSFLSTLLLYSLLLLLLLAKEGVFQEAFSRLLLLITFLILRCLMVLWRLVLLC